MFVEIMAFLMKIFASHYCISFFHIFSMIIQSYIKACFCLSYILCLLHKMHSIKRSCLDRWRCGISHIFFGLFFGWLFFVIACNKVTLNLSVMESICLVFFLCLPFLTLFFSILLLRINSLRFLFCLNAVTNID